MVGAYWQERNQRIEVAQQRMAREATVATLEIERELRNYQQPAASLAALLANTSPLSGEFSTYIEQQMSLHPHLDALGAAYSLFGFNQGTMFYAPGYIRGSDRSANPFQLQTAYDYTQPQFQWFRQALNWGAHWGEPYVRPGRYEERATVGFYVPFYREGETSDTPQGVIYSEYQTQGLEQIVESLRLGKTGYGFLISETGSFVVHPNAENVLNRRSIFEGFPARDERPLVETIDRALAGEIVETTFVDRQTGQKSWLYLQPLELNHWVIGIVLLEQEVLLDSTASRRWGIWISLSVLPFLLSLASLILHTQQGSTLRLWILSAVASLLLLGQIGFVWRLALSDRNYSSDRFLLLNQADSEKLLAPQIRLGEQIGQEPVLKIPTGILVQSLDLSSASDVFLTAYIWQRYRDGIHDELERGFILPDAIDANDLDIQQVYSHRDGDTEVVGWYVEATLRQDFDYSRYPLDRKDIEIQIWHQDLNRRVALVPDYNAYDFMNPQTRPGINADLALYGWNLDVSFFEYKFRNYSTNLGLSDRFYKGELPDLYFTVTVKREFVDPLISRLVALICVISLLFAMLLVLNNDRAMEVLAIGAGLIFIAVVDHISVREEIAASGLVYFDYFYFLIYGYIFIIAAIALLLLNDTPTPQFLKYKNNLITQLLYWPTLLGTLLLLTLSVFY